MDNNSHKTVKFSKNNPIIEVSSKQSKAQTSSQQVVPPIKPKETKKK